MRESKFTIVLFLLLAKLQVALAGFFVPGPPESTQAEFTAQLQVRNDSPFAICNVTVNMWDRVEKKAFEWRELESEALSKNQSFTYYTIFNQKWAVGFADCDGYLKCESNSGNPFDEREIHGLTAKDEQDRVLIHIHAHTIAPKYGTSREQSVNLFYSIEDVEVDANKRVKVDYTYRIDSKSESSTGAFDCRWTGPDIPRTHDDVLHFMRLTPSRFGLGVARIG